MLRAVVASAILNINLWLCNRVGSKQIFSPSAATSVMGGAFVGAPRPTVSPHERMHEER